MQRNLLYGTLLIALFFVNACSVTEVQKTTGFKAVKVGRQVWMAENLRVSRFRNGDLIHEVKTKEEWEKAGEEGRSAWCCYENDAANGKKYGKLYNWYAVNDARGLAPEGWHVPTENEWNELTDQLGGEDSAGLKLKSTSGWEYYNGTNESGFNGMPGGYRNNLGYFYQQDRYGYWWTSTEVTSGEAWSKLMIFSYHDVTRYNHKKSYGFFVRCVQDTK